MPHLYPIFFDRSRPLLGLSSAGISNRPGVACALLGLAKRELVLGGLEALLLAGEKGVDGSIELVATLEEVKLHHEEEADEVTAELADERASSGSRSTWFVRLA